MNLRASATRQEVHLGGPPTRTRWGGYHLAGPGGLRGQKASSTRKIKPQTSNLPEYADDLSEFLPLTGQQHADVRTKCTLIKKWCKKKLVVRHVKTAIRKGSNWGDFLKRLEQLYPVYDTDLSVRTEIEELPPLPEFPTPARFSEFVAHLEELMGRMNPLSYGPTEPHGEDCRETAERKARTHSYDHLVDVLIEFAMERENDSHMDTYLRKHLRTETPAEKSPGGEVASTPLYPSGGPWLAAEALD